MELVSFAHLFITGVHAEEMIIGDFLGRNNLERLAGHALAVTATLALCP